MAILKYKDENNVIHNINTVEVKRNMNKTIVVSIENGTISTSSNEVGTVSRMLVPAYRDNPPMLYVTAKTYSDITFNYWVDDNGHIISYSSTLAISPRL